MAWKIAMLSRTASVEERRRSEDTPTLKGWSWHFTPTRDYLWFFRRSHGKSTLGPPPATSLVSSLQCLSTTCGKWQGSNGLKVKLLLLSNFWDAGRPQERQSGHLGSEARGSAVPGGCWKGRPVCRGDRLQRFHVPLRALPRTCQQLQCNLCDWCFTRARWVPQGVPSSSHKGSVHLRHGCSRIQTRDASHCMDLDRA